MAKQPETHRDRRLPEGIEVREGERGERIRVTFNFQGKRRRETLRVPVTEKNISYAARLRGEIMNAIERGTFEYGKFFPNSKQAKTEARSKHKFLVTDLIKAYINLRQDSKSCSPSTIATYTKWYRARFAQSFEGIYIDDLGPAKVREWIVSLTKELQPKSYRNCIWILNSVLEVAEADGIIEKNPISKIKLRTILPIRKKTNDEFIDPFNATEIAAILNACQTTEERSLFQFAFASGLRTGELIGLKWHHIDWRENLIHVQDNVVMGEVGTVEAPKQRPIEKDTKSANTDQENGGERYIPILPAARQALVAMKSLSLVKDPDGFVFLNSQGQRWENDQQIRARWRIVLRIAEVRYRNPYQTRHTFASTLLEAGESELVVAKLLGHATVEMVRRHYGKCIKDVHGKIPLRASYTNAFGAAPGLPQTE